MNLLDLDNDCLNIIGNIVKQNNKDNIRTEKINEAFEYCMNVKKPIGSLDLPEIIQYLLNPYRSYYDMDYRRSYYDNYIYRRDYEYEKENEEDYDKVLLQLEEAGYDLTEYYDYKYNGI